jgi:hypothetical protein
VPRCPSVTDLQEFIFNSPQALFGELQEDLFLVGKEIQPSEIVRDRIEALDRDGRAGLKGKVMPPPDLPEQFSPALEEE